MISQCSVQSATIMGVEAVPVSVEVVISQGLPGFTIVGMTDAAIQEARERIRAALRSSGFSMPGDKIVVNLAPGTLKKRGSGFDLPIAVGILVASGQIRKSLIEGSLFVGELSLDGRVRQIPGLLAFAQCAALEKLSLTCPLPGEWGIEECNTSFRVLEKLSLLRNGAFHLWEGGDVPDVAPVCDFAEVAGHDHAKRALQIAATGNHGVILVGPPGSGKTMLASRLPSILPPLSQEEKLEVATIYSVAGLNTDAILAGRRPFRAPHHSASCAGLVGGGNPPRPGEITLAHRGVLYLDELPEFKPSVLQSLRQPMESGSVTLVRAELSVTMPARFSLVASANPCPCGYFGDKETPCTCSPAQINAYQLRVGGPVLDRIDMRIRVGRMRSADVLRSGEGVSSRKLRDGVEAGRVFRRWRKARFETSGSSSQEIIESCRLDAEGERYIENLAEKRRFSGRAVIRSLSVARTIADLAESEEVTKAHICEAVGLRMDQAYQGV